MNLSRPLPLFRALGVPVALDPSWIFLAFLITWSLASGVFPAVYPGYARAVYWAMGACSTLGLLLSAFAHEVSRVWAARHRGTPPRRVTLFLFGGISEGEPPPRSPGAEVEIALLGPATSFLLAGFFYGLFLWAADRLWHDPVVGVLGYIAMLNLAVGVFNLLPAFPLDGGRLLRAAFWAWTKDLSRAAQLTAGVGNGIGWFFVGLGVLEFFSGNFVAGLSWMLLGLFVRSAASLALLRVVNGAVEELPSMPSPSLRNVA